MIEKRLSSSFAHVSLGWALLWKRRHFDAIAAQKRAIELDPGYADAYNRLAATLAFAGRGDEGANMAEKAMRLNPNGRAGYPYNLGLNNFVAGRYEDAIAALQRSLTRSPEFAPAYFFLAASNMRLGRMKEAKRAAGKLRDLSPNASIDYWRSRFPFKDESDLNEVFVSLADLL